MIAVVDSGIGGLTVAREIEKQLPMETIIYVGDNARCPYGDKTLAELRQYVEEILFFLQNLPLKAIVIACNTLDALYLEDIKSRFGVPVIGVIEPGVRTALRQTASKEIALIATSRTVETGAHRKLIEEQTAEEVNVYANATPAYVPFIEEGRFGSEEERIVREGLRFLQGNQADVLLLGCTHYPLIQRMIETAIQSELPRDIRIINPAEETVRVLRRELFLRNQLSTMKEEGDCYWTSGDPSWFLDRAEVCLGHPIQVKPISFGTGGAKTRTEEKEINGKNMIEL